MPTPAETLAAKKRWRRPPRNKAVSRKPVWVCLVRDRREVLRLSLRDVGAAVGVSITALFQIEHGGETMLSTARKLALFFGTTTDELWPKLMKE